MNDLIPIIESDRLLLTAHSVEDFPAMLRMWQDPIATKFVPPGPLKREECWAIWLQYRGMWAEFGFGYWAIKDKASQAFIGEIGFGDFQRETVPPLPPMMELGFILHPDYHRQGYAYEATSAVLAWQAEHFTLPVGCLTLPDNLSSLKLAKKCGFSFNQRVRYDQQQLCVGLLEPLAAKLANGEA